MKNLSNLEFSFLSFYKEWKDYPSPELEAYINKIMVSEKGKSVLMSLKTKKFITGDGNITPLGRNYVHLLGASERTMRSVFYASLEYISENDMLKDVIEQTNTAFKEMLTENLLSTIDTPTLCGILKNLSPEKLGDLNNCIYDTLLEKGIISE